MRTDHIVDRAPRHAHRAVAQQGPGAASPDVDGCAWQGEGRAGVGGGWSPQAAAGGALRAHARAGRDGTRRPLSRRCKTLTVADVVDLCQHHNARLLGGRGKHANQLLAVASGQQRDVASLVCRNPAASQRGGGAAGRGAQEERSAQAGGSSMRPWRALSRLARERLRGVVGGSE